MCQDVLAAAKALATPLQSLKVVCNVGRGGVTKGEKAADAIAALTQLQSLKLLNISPVNVPSTLTALTCLHVDHSQSRSTRAKLTQSLGRFKSLKVLTLHCNLSDILCCAVSACSWSHREPMKLPCSYDYVSQRCVQQTDFQLLLYLAMPTRLSSSMCCVYQRMFSSCINACSLQELAVVDVTISDLNQFSKELPSLTALTSLDLRYPAVKDRQVSISGEHSIVFAKALTACTSLISLTLGVPQTVKETQMGSYKRLDTIPPMLSDDIISAIAALSSLTSLAFSGRADMSLDTRVLEDLWQQMSHLGHLSITSEHRWQHYVHTVGHLTCLKSFHLCTQGAISSGCKADSLTEALPVSLTSLELQCSLTRIPQLATLTELRCIRLSDCCLDGPHLTSFQSLCSLHTLTTEGKRREYIMSNTDGLLLVSSLPVTCMTELRLAGQVLPLDAVPLIAALTALQHLDVGTVRSVALLVSLTSHVSRLGELRTLTLRRPDPVMVNSQALVFSDLLGSLHKLPKFVPLDSASDLYSSN